MNVLVAMDLSESSDALLKGVSQWAQQFPADYWLVHVAEPDPDFMGYEPGPQTVRDQVAAKFHKEHQRLQKAAEDLKALGVKATALLVQGATIECLLSEASRLKADMIVVGSHGHGPVHQLLVGSVSEGILRKATCPVLVIPTHHKS
jgi:nucleotide-binding universal stress UspA family protein